MKTGKLLFKNSILLLLLFFLIAFGCRQQTSAKNKIRGKWHSADGKTRLTITQKEFTLNEGEEPIAESYFVKGDSIFTSYEGSQPFTKFVIKNVSDKTLTLVYPDSTSVNFMR
ncbi:MAG: hypothetical protein V5804_08595 [Mucilaginibacter sp.]|uniref:hypothetical protein n=1 Tax=Mucilaginibacter sp. TaxID=1882438 RepID=UPI0034E3781D